MLLIYAFTKKKKIEHFVILGIYVILLIVAYFYASVATVKFIPVFTSMAFIALFTEAALHKKTLIYTLTKKFYKKKLNSQEILYLKKGDMYWAVSIFIYMIFQVLFIYYANDTLWAFYNSVGWYIYFLIILGLQIIYGKIYAIKMSS
jgi:hypothetical protein